MSKEGCLAFASTLRDYDELGIASFREKRKDQSIFSLVRKLKGSV
jgi:hypothetical protein